MTAGQAPPPGTAVDPTVPVPGNGIRLRLPATSANLGPAFDAAGLAMTLFLEIEAAISEDDVIEATGRDTSVTGARENNLMLDTYRAILGALKVPAPALAIRLHNEIPLGMGCGSSAAALCAGVLLANHFGQLHWSEEQILSEAARREGHPDNVAACLCGGFTLSKMLERSPAGSVQETVAVTVGRTLGWRLLLALPRRSLATSEARALLPPAYSRADATRNVQSTALLVAAFANDRPDLLRTATEDTFHQPYRLAVCPLLAALLPLAGTDGVYSVTLSGAGPSVLLIVSPAVAERAVMLAAKGLATKVLTLAIHGEPVVTLDPSNRGQGY